MDTIDYYGILKVALENEDKNEEWKEINKSLYEMFQELECKIIRDFQRIFDDVQEDMHDEDIYI